MNNKTGNWILIGMVIGALVGAFGGYFFGGVFTEIKFLGTIFLNALKMIVIPLIVASMIVGVTSLGDIRKLGRTTGKTLLYYLATTGFSVLIGIILVNLIRPGIGVPPLGASIPEFVPGSGAGTIVDVIVGLVPDNIFAAAADGRILPLIVFSLVFGGVLTAIGRKGKPVIDFFVGLNAAIMKIVILIIYFAPIGIMALIGGIVAAHRDSLQQIVTGLGLYSLTVIAGLLIHAIVILPLILKLFGRKNPFQYFLNMGQALATAFTTASSSATLPVTMESVTDKNKVDSKASSFVLPLGATINMDGTALYEAVAAIFIAQIYGIDLSIGAQVIIFFTATLASIGAAAIPEAGLVMMTLVLSAVGLPLEGIGIILAIDWFLDRCRTTVNVWGDSIGAAVIGETAEIKEYKGRSPRKPDSDKRQKQAPRSDEKREHPPRGGKSDRYKRSDRSKGPRRQDSRKRYSRKDESKRSFEHKARPSRNRKESIRPSQDTIKRDLEKVQKQLTAMGTGENRHETEPAKSSKGKNDDFFSEGVPEFNFFDDKGKARKPSSSADKDEPSLQSGPDEKTKQTPGDIPEPKIPVISVPTSDMKGGETKSGDEAENKEEDSWGRGKKKRPHK